jgi:hypothetical protein
MNSIILPNFMSCCFLMLLCFPGCEKEIPPPPVNSSNSSGGNCTGSYQSPSSDAQLNAWCYSAYDSRCIKGLPLSDPYVQAVCSYYNDFREPGTNECPYCK